MIFEFRVLRCRQNGVIRNKSTAGTSKMYNGALVLRSLKYVPSSVLAEDARLNFVRCWLMRPPASTGDGPD